LFQWSFEVKYLDFETISGRYRMFTDLGLLALRLVLGAVFLAHGAQKAFGAFGGPGFEGAAGFIGSMGFRPARFWTALAVGGELAAGFLFLLGLLTPLAGLLVLATMAVAIAKVHGPKGFFVQDGGYEYNLVLIVTALAVAAMGPGRFSLDYLLGLAR
jgi:putative oxidoreductase